MKRLNTMTLSIALACALLAGLGAAQAQDVQPLAGSAATAALGTAFTYQGQLRKSGAPVNGMCNFQFSLYNALSGGTQIGATQTRSSVSVSNGLFTIPDLDFGGGAFNGEARWLAISVQCPGDSGYTALSPRQALTPAPYALALPGLWTQQNATSPNLVGGYHGNQVTAGVVGATIGGGGDASNPNRVTDDYGTVGGGSDNQAGDNAGTTYSRPYATVGGGDSNTASGPAATVGGGQFNNASGQFSTVGGGAVNNVAAANATIGGGVGNVIRAAAATIPGGHAAQATHHGELAYASGMFANPGDAQFSLYVLRKSTTSASATPLYLDGAGAQISIAPGRTVAFEILVAARDNSGNSAAYRFQGVVENIGAGAVLLSPSGGILHEDVPSWDSALAVSGSNLVIQALGGTSASPVRWVAVVRTAQVGW